MSLGGESSPLRLLRCAGWCCLLLLWVTGRAAEERRHYDVPAGDAATTLKRFAAQARREIMFPAEDVKGLKTNSVRGELTEREALSRLLANTGLISVRDEATGTLLITPAAPRPSEHPPPPSAQSPQTPTP